MKHGKQRRDYCIPAEPDGLKTHEVGVWAQEKYRYVGMYAEMFATGMKNSWDRRVYLDLFSGPGFVKVRNTGRVLLGSPLVALSLPDLFDAYVFSDENSESLSALQQRARRFHLQERCSFVAGDVNDKVEDITRIIPGDALQKTLSFCFLDPYKLNIRFETVSALARGRNIDFLILLALHVDANRNLQTYIRDESSTIAEFLGDFEWRDKWREGEKSGTTFVEFLAASYSDRMAQIGYIPMGLGKMVKIRTDQRNLPLYYLAFFSRHQKGLVFWKEVLKYANDQLPLGL